MSVSLDVSICRIRVKQAERRVIPYYVADKGRLKEIAWHLAVDSNLASTFSSRPFADEHKGGHEIDKDVQPACNQPLAEEWQPRK